MVCAAIEYCIALVHHLQRIDTWPFGQVKPIVPFGCLPRGNQETCWIAMNASFKDIGIDQFLAAI